MKNQIKTFSKLVSNKNMMFSPVSFNAVLAILSEIASGDTREKIQEYLEKDYSSFISEFMKDKKNDDKNIFAFNNGMWIEEKYQVSSRIQQIQELYNANIIRADFKNIDSLAREINFYVDKNTFHMIPEIVKPKDLKGSDSVIANVVYFQSPWVDSLHRKKDVFQDFKGNKTETDFVLGKADGYMENNYAVGFSKSYENGLQFIGILSKEENCQIENLNIEELLKSKNYNYNVSIGMPILNFESNMELSSLLPSLGLEDLLTGRNMIELYEDKTSFHISKLMQNTKIELDENGTKASAATVSIGIRNCACVFKECKEIILNRSFIFLIYDEQNQEIVFIGKVVSV